MNRHDLWGYVVDPDKILLCSEVPYLGLDSDLNYRELMKLRKEKGFTKGMNSFVLYAVNHKILRMVEPLEENELSGTFIFKGTPRYGWSIEDDMFFINRMTETRPFYALENGGKSRLIRGEDCLKCIAPYNPVSEKADGDIVWYDSTKKEKLVMKAFNGSTLARVVPNEEFDKILQGKSCSK